MMVPALFHFTPSLMKPEELESIFVQREQLATDLVERICESVLTSTKHHTLIVGARGMGKTHLVSLVYHRVCERQDLKNRLLIAWMKEEEWSITSFQHLLMRILKVLQVSEPAIKEQVESLYDLPLDEVDHVGVQLLKTILGERTLLLIIENLDAIFSGLGEKGQKKLRAFLQETACCTILATTQGLFNGVRRHTAPFYGFFRPVHLKTLTLDEGIQLLVKIAQVRHQPDLETFLRTPTGRARIEAVAHLAGGTPRIYVIFSEFLTRQSLDQLIDPFMQMLDDLTPYYQERMRWLSPQQRTIIELLCDRKSAISVKEIAQRCFVTHQTASSQLKDLRDKGYVSADQIGRQSFYELREPLMRICMSVKQYRGEPIRLIVDFLRTWYPRQELEAMQASLMAEPAQNQLMGEYLQLALADSDLTESDPKTRVGLEEIDELLQQGDYDAGLKIAEKLIRKNPEVGHETYAVCLWYLGRYEEALDHLNTAIEIKPNFLKALVERGYVLNQLGCHEDAHADFQKALDITPDASDHAAWDARGNALSGMGLYEEAIASYEKAIEIKPDFHLAWTNRGLELFHLGRYEDALACYEKAIEIKPDFHLAWTTRGIALGNLGCYEDALASFDKAIKIKPDYREAWINRGLVLVDLGRYEDAIASYDQVLELNPDDLSVQLERAELLLQLNRWNEGYAALDQGLHRLMKANQPYPGDAKAAVLGIFKNTDPDNVQQWRSRIIKLVDLFETYQALSVLGVSLAKSCDALITPMVSDAAAMAWQDAWVEVVGDRDEFQIALRLLNATIHYKQTPDDPRVFLELPVEERKLLRQILSK